MKLALSSSVVIAWLAAVPDALQQVGRARASAGDVLVVDDDGGVGVGFVDLQAAVDAAGEGDVILVRGGTYSGFIVDGKALTVQADTGATVDVASPSSVSVNVVNLGAGQSVVLRGLHVEGGSLGIEPPFQQSYRAGFSATDNAGSVWVEDCRIRGTAGGAVVRDSASVAFVRSRLRGEDLAGVFGFQTSPGGAGLDCAGSSASGPPGRSCRSATPRRSAQVTATRRRAAEAGR